MLGAVAARIEDQVPELAGRVEQAARLAELMAKPRTQSPLAAFVAPVGLRGGKPTVSAGAYQQPIEETIAVVLLARAGTRDGDRALIKIDPLIRAVIYALVGWSDGETTGQFTFVECGVVSWTEGVLIYRWTFAIDDQLRSFS